MANLMFKRGTQANLNTLRTNNSITDGTFYLTTDTNRLYVGQDKGGAEGVKLVDLNQYIRIVENVDALIASTGATDGDFAYCISENILAVYRSALLPGTPWVQINQNTNTTINKVEFLNDDDTSKVLLKLTDSAQGYITDFFKLLGTKGVSVTTNMSGENLEIIVEGDIYTLTSSFAGDNPEVNATSYTLDLNSSKDTDGAGGSATLTAGTNVTFKKLADNNLQINAAGLIAGRGSRVNADPDVPIYDNNFAVNGGAATVTITDTNGKSATAVVDAENGFYYILNGNKVYNQSTLDVYTKEQIDGIFRDLNGLTYKGTVDTWEAVQAKQTSGVKVGDMYLFSATPQGVQPADVIFSTDVTVSSIQKGDLIIAVAKPDTTEDATTGNLDVENIRWTVVKTGIETTVDTTYTGRVNATNNKLTITPNTDENDVAAGIDLEAGKSISLTSEAADYDKVLKTTINHGSAGETANSDSVLSTTVLTDATSVTSVSSVDRDEFGHVTQVNTETRQLMTYQLSGATVSQEGNQVTVVDALTDSANGQRGTSTFKINQTGVDNISLSVQNNEINIAMVWGEF